ncbi:MAG TPA: FAD-binding dehydrogenase [Thermoleophilaceae bacterium]|nr:FAD-binding dehydrogenase [Thermoleophilaceae bacterium]
MADAHQEADVVVIGAGIAGLTAALELLNNGRQVTLLDRCHPEEVGGLAREAFGGMFMVDSPQQRRSGIDDSYDLALDDWLRIAGFDEQDVWPRRWAEQYVARARDDVGRWLSDQGLKFFPVVNWAERGMYSDGNSVPRFHLAWGCGQGLVDAVWGKLQGHDNRDDLVVHFETRVTELIENDDGAITGVALEDGTEIRANSTLVAAGGIGGNLDLVKREWPKDMGDPPEQLLMGSHYYADGALHDEVRKHGGNVTHIDRMWNYADAVRHPKPRRPLHGVKLIPPRSGLMLDPDGRRYGPVPVMPTFDARYALERMCEDPRKYSWLVCNRKIAIRELDVSGSEHNPQIREKRLGRFILSVLAGKPNLVDYFVDHCPDFVVADTLPELAQRMNEVTGNDDLDADLMTSEIKRYDDNLARGKALWNDDQIRRIAQYRNWRGDRLRTSKFQRIADPKAGPLLAIRLQPMARKSLGGIQTDLESRVLHAETGQPIRGLYAAGEAAGFGGGGMHGRRSLEGTFLGGCVFSARIAAQSIAHGDTVTHSTNGDVPASAVEAE